MSLAYDQGNPKTTDNRYPSRMRTSRHAAESKLKTVIGPRGDVLTLADLPPPGAKRWGIRKKAEVVVAVEGNLLSVSEACERYNMAVEEFLGWQQTFGKYGLPGLRASCAGQYRDTMCPPSKTSKRNPKKCEAAFRKIARQNNGQEQNLDSI